MRHRDTHLLGDSAAAVTKLGFGAAALGSLFTAVTERDAVAALDQAWTHDIRYFDTAPYYGYGTSEQRVGSMLSDKPRDSFCLSTKVGRLLRKDVGQPAANEFRGSYTLGAIFDYGYDATWQSIEESLERLRLERIDVALLHDLDPTVHESDAYERYVRQAFDGGCRALEEMRRTGVVSAIGRGINDAPTAERFTREMSLDVVLLAGRYTLLEHANARSLFAECDRRGISVVIGSPFNSGVLADDAHSNYDYAPAPASILARVEQIRAICAHHCVSLGAASLQFPFGQPAVAAVIPGMRDAGEVRQNVEWLDAPIPQALWENLRTEGLLLEGVPMPAERLNNST